MTWLGIVRSTNGFLTKALHHARKCSNFSRHTIFDVALGARHTAGYPSERFDLFHQVSSWKMKSTLDYEIDIWIESYLSNLSYQLQIDGVFFLRRLPVLEASPWAGKWDLPINPNKCACLTVGNLPPLNPSFSRQTPTIQFPRSPTSETWGFPSTRP